MSVKGLHRPFYIGQPINWSGFSVSDIKAKVFFGKLNKYFLILSVGILKRNVAQETIQNRAARSLGNLAMDPQSCALIHSSGKCQIVIVSDRTSFSRHLSICYMMQLL